MKFNSDICRMVNDLRFQIQVQTGTIDEGESVSILLWWTFIKDHASCHGFDPKQLAMKQLEAFLDNTDLIELAREH